MSGKELSLVRVNDYAFGIFVRHEPITMTLVTEHAAAASCGLPGLFPVDPRSYAGLRRLAEELADIPGVGKVEIADGRVIVTMPPVNRHELVVLRLWRQLDAQVGTTHPGYIAHSGAAVEAPGLGRLRRPDIVVFPEAGLEGTAGGLRPDEVLLVVEVVSRPNPWSDYRDKVRDYTAMGIPHYVIVDPRDGTGIVHTLLGYRQRTAFVFGDTVGVGPWKLDTGELLTYGPPRESETAGG